MNPSESEPRSQSESPERDAPRRNPPASREVLPFQQRVVIPTATTSETGSEQQAAQPTLPRRPEQLLGKRRQFPVFDRQSGVYMGEATEPASSQSDDVVAVARIEETVQPPLNNLNAPSRSRRRDSGVLVPLMAEDASTTAPASTSSSSLVPTLENANRHRHGHRHCHNRRRSAYIPFVPESPPPPPPLSRRGTRAQNQEDYSNIRIGPSRESFRRTISRCSIV